MNNTNGDSHPADWDEGSSLQVSTSLASFFFFPTAHRDDCFGADASAADLGEKRRGKSKTLCGGPYDEERFTCSCGQAEEITKMGVPHIVS